MKYMHMTSIHTGSLYFAQFFADRTATQYDRLRAVGIILSSVILSVTLCIVVLGVGVQG